MRIEGSPKSKAMKRGTDKQVAAALGVDLCLTKMVGKLELNATQSTDFALLRELFWVFMGGGAGGGGSIDITNAKGEKFTYTSPNKEELKKLKSKKSVGVN
jgi:hypothetical protein